MTFFDPGRLNRRVSIRYQTSTQDAAGQPQDTWTELAAVWADIRNQRGMESIRADKPASEVQTSIRCRYRTDLNAGMRVVHGPTTYLVDAVLPDESARKWVDLVCKVVR